MEDKKFQMQCQYCGVRFAFREKLLGQTRDCPKCGKQITLSAVDSAPHTPQQSPSGEKFPERMKANKVLEGRVCNHCRKQVELGDDVFNCQKCNSTMHLACHQQRGGCASPSCSMPGKLDFAEPVAPPKPTYPVEDLVPCRFCHENIQRTARKCRFCGEYQRELDRNRQKKLRQTADADDDLTAAEIIFAIICANLACIVGIVWLIQGKKKGGKMIGIAVAANAVGILIQLLIEMG